jgi:hypothetical protein
MSSHRQTLCCLLFATKFLHLLNFSNYKEHSTFLTNYDRYIIKTLNKNSKKKHLKSQFHPHIKHIASSTEVLALCKGVVGFFPDIDTLWQSAECLLVLNQEAHIVTSGFKSLSYLL